MPTRRKMHCECGTALDEDGACATCAPLKRPTARALHAAKLARRRADAATAHSGIAKAIRVRSRDLSPATSAASEASRARCLRGLGRLPASTRAPRPSWDWERQ